MKEDLISFETAKLAKEKGFDIPTIQYYTIKGYCTESEGYMTERYAVSNWNNGMGSYPTRTEEVSCSAPTQSLLAKWLREKHNLYVYPILQYPYYGYEIRKIQDDDKLLKEEIQIGDDFEEAHEFGLQESLKLI